MSSSQPLILVTGGGGFIGGHLVRDLMASGDVRVRAVDEKPFEEWFYRHPGADNRRLDLRLREACNEAAAGAVALYDFAAAMGGMGFIESNKAVCMLNVLIGSHMLLAARDAGVQRFFFSSSACVYNADKQRSTSVEPLRESDAYPALPEDGYGWEKLFIERMCRHFWEDFGLETRVARYHNVYGPWGTYDGGREKSPAAICRKVALAKLNGASEIEIWGDGEQTRSYMFIDDCLYGTKKIMASEVREPLNLGSSRLVSINQLVGIVEDIAGLKLKRRYDLSAPQGVRGRNSDNTRIKQLLTWEPAITLEEGLEQTYRWIYDQLTGAAPKVLAAVL